MLINNKMFGQTENILFCKHGFNEACFPMDLFPTPYATTRVLPSAPSVTSYHFSALSCSLLPTLLNYSRSSSLPCVRLALQLGEMWCWHTRLLTGQGVLHGWLKGGGTCRDGFNGTVMLQPFCWGFSVLPSLSSSQCLIFTMLVENQYVLGLCIFGWNWLLVQNLLGKGIIYRQKNKQTNAA